MSLRDTNDIEIIMLDTFNSDCVIVRSNILGPPTNVPEPYVDLCATMRISDSVPGVRVISRSLVLRCVSIVGSLMVETTRLSIAACRRRRADMMCGPLKAIR